MTPDVGVRAGDNGLTKICEVNLPTFLVLVSAEEAQEMSAGAGLTLLVAGGVISSVVAFAFIVF